MTQITNYENDTGRQARLHRVMSGMILEFGVEPVCERIARLHDHKGVLVVTWFGSQDDAMVGMLERLWEFSGEPKFNIEHELA